MLSHRFDPLPYERGPDAAIPEVGKYVDRANLTGRFVDVTVTAGTDVDEPDDDAVDLRNEDLLVSDLSARPPLAPRIGSRGNRKGIQVVVGDLTAIRDLPRLDMEVRDGIDVLGTRFADANVAHGNILTNLESTTIVSYMVKCQTLDRTFSALSDPTRRDILERLSRGPASISELAHPFGLSLPGLMKHVRILEEAELVTTEKKGRTRECRLGDEQLDDVSAWVEQYQKRWERRLDRLESYLDKKKRGRR